MSYIRTEQEPSVYQSTPFPFDSPSGAPLQSGSPGHTYTKNFLVNFQVDFSKHGHLSSMTVENHPVIAQQMKDNNAVLLTLEARHASSDLSYPTGISVTAGTKSLNNTINVANGQSYAAVIPAFARHIDLQKTVMDNQREVHDPVFQKYNNFTQDQLRSEITQLQHNPHQCYILKDGRLAEFWGANEGLFGKLEAPIDNTFYKVPSASAQEAFKIFQELIDQKTQLNPKLEYTLHPLTHTEVKDHHTVTTTQGTFGHTYGSSIHYMTPAQREAYHKEAIHNVSVEFRATFLGPQHTD